ncbi:MAG: hypothetical protein BGO98_07825 [Myxococcales bacterium 68-20]|nr:MAG: hypothetical protein BGO98_07825 [Myxococcales bacterium 68-20]
MALGATMTATAASVLAFSCGGGSHGEDWSDAGADVAAPDAGRRPVGNTGDAGPRDPEYDDDGWLRLDVDPDYECPNYTPTRADQMPPGIEWEPCPEHVLAVYPSCRRMKTDGAFNARLNGFRVAGRTGLVDPDGKVLLAFVRASGKVIHYLVGEADGSIRHAVHHDGAAPCRLEVARLARGRALYQFYRHDEDEDGRWRGYRWGAIGGALDEPAVVLESLVDEYRRYSAGPDVFLDGNAFRAWAPNAPVLGSLGERVHSVDPGIFVGEALFFGPNTGSDTHRVRIHQPGSGVRDFLWYGDDIASAAANFGTDGKDMVWIEAFGRTHVGDSWSAIDLVTAPYTTDPGKIDKRRLRSMEMVGLSPFVVGCGHAAPSSLYGSGHTITRLGDGRFTLFEDVRGADGGAGMAFTKTLAITCDEVFAEMIGIGGFDFSVVRIQLEDFGLGRALDGGR